MGVLTKVFVRISHLPEKNDVHGFFFPTWRHAGEAVQSLAGAGIPFAMIRLSNATETTTNLALAGHEKQIAILTRKKSFEFGIRNLEFGSGKVECRNGKSD